MRHGVGGEMYRFVEGVDRWIGRLKRLMMALHSFWSIEYRHTDRLDVYIYYHSFMSHTHITDPEALLLLHHYNTTTFYPAKKPRD